MRCADALVVNSGVVGRTWHSWCTTQARMEGSRRFAYLLAPFLATTRFTGTEMVPSTGVILFFPGFVTLLGLGQGESSHSEYATRFPKEQSNCKGQLLVYFDD